MHSVWSRAYGERVKSHDKHAGRWGDKSERQCSDRVLGAWKVLLLKLPFQPELFFPLVSDKVPIIAPILAFDRPPFRTLNPTHQFKNSGHNTQPQLINQRPTLP